MPPLGYGLAGNAQFLRELGLAPVGAKDIKNDWITLFHEP